MVFIKRIWITKYAGVTVCPFLEAQCVGHINQYCTQGRKSLNVNNKEESKPVVAVLDLALISGAEFHVQVEQQTIYVFRICLCLYKQT